MSLFSNKQMRIIFIYCVIIILVICGIITARHKKTSSDSIVKTTKTNNETSESSDTQHTSDNTPNTHPIREMELAAEQSWAIAA